MSEPTLPLTITDAAAALRDGSVTSVDLTRYGQEVADRDDPTLGTFLKRFDESALEAAAAADAELAAGVDRGPLHGIPIGVKDIIAARESETTAQSVVFDPTWWAGADAPVVARLRAAGAVIPGKLSTCEYAIGLPDDTEPYPVPRNPWDPATWPGGSSSGSGSGVAAGMFLGALGTDTGGSIRMPAAFCGITGMKATYGLVPKAGCYPLGVTYDHIGPMARSAADCAAMLEVLAGYDPSDPSMIPGIGAPVVTGALDGDLSGLTIGVERANHLGLDGADPALDGLFEAAVAVLAAAGAELVEVELPHFTDMVTADFYGFMVEAFAYHQRFLQTRYTDYGKPTREYLGAGAFVTGADYAQAQKVRRVGKAALDELMTSVDLVVSPTAAVGAPAIDGLGLDELIELLFTPYWNSVGNPAISAPMGFTGGGLPLGLHIAGRPLEDALVLKAADAYQRATDFHLQVPSPALAAT